MADNHDRRISWRARVQATYSCLAELRSYNRVYGVARRCGFRSALAMWRANPTIGGSSDPRDFGVVAP